MTTPSKVKLARACIADSERSENSIGTRVDAAIQAIAYLDQMVLKGPDVQQYMEQKYQRPPDAFELGEYHPWVLALAKRLLSTVDLSSCSAEGAWPESAAGLLEALRNGTAAAQVNLFGRPCSSAEANKVLAATDQVQAARELMTKKLNEWSPNESI